MKIEQYRTLYKILRQEHLINMNTIKKAFRLYKASGLAGVRAKVAQILGTSRGYEDYDKTVLHGLLNMKPLPESANDILLLTKVTVDIIIPVYKGLSQTKRCILSVLATTDVLKVKHRIIILNDASPEKEITQFLRALPQADNLILIENEVNLGFTATVNKGMQLSKTNDVVLLNSDTEVANNWLDKLVYHTFSNRKIATVTPFSNNATICSYPTIHGMNELPAEESTQSLDLACYNANAGHHIELPTAVGFCMYIRRTCLNDIGFFDVETYGKGYGEENDFCIRASQKGWKHLLAADTFVYHQGEASFQEESEARKAAAMNIIRKLYPSYEQDVMTHIAANEVYVYRLSTTIARFRLSNRPAILHISHNLGGGTEKHISMLYKENNQQANLLIMKPVNNLFVEIRSANKEDAFCLKIAIADRGVIIALLKMFQFKFVHLHHSFGYALHLKYIIDSLNLPFYFTVHDYHSICPRITLMRPAGGYCGEPHANSCNRCLSMNTAHSASNPNILEWRKENAWLFKEAVTVICPSFDVRDRCKRYYPDAAYQVVPHEQPLEKANFVSKINKIYANEPLVILLVGAIGPHKGYQLLKESVLITQQYNFPLFFNLIGYAAEEISNDKKFFHCSGAYKDEELMDKITEVGPHIILFTSIAPETYCYTLTAALKSNLPIMAPNAGAFPERLSNRPWTWLYEVNNSAMDLVDTLCQIREQYFKNGLAPEVIESPYKGERYVEEFYKKEYLQSL